MSANISKMTKITLNIKLLKDTVFSLSSLYILHPPLNMVNIIAQ